MSGAAGGRGTAGVPAGVPVEGDARAWIAESLADGLGLAARVLARVGARGPAGGTVRALAGGGTSAGAGAGAGCAAARLGSWEALEDGVEGSFGGAVAELAALLAAGPVLRGGRVLLVEDELSAPGDPALEGREAHLLACGSEVLHWRAVTPALDAAALTELLGSATSGYPTNAFVVAPAPTGGGPADIPAWGPWAELAEQELDIFAARVEAVVVAAYDAEGLLWWEPGA